MENQITYLQKLNNAFSVAEYKYKRALKRIESGKYDLSIQEINGQLIWQPMQDVNYRNVENIPTDYLATQGTALILSNEFKTEIENKWLIDDKNYFSFLELRLSYHFNFLKKYWRDALSFYSLNKEETNDLIQRIRQTGTVLNKEEVLMALKLTFLNIFELFEETLSNYYPAYQKKLNIFFSEGELIISNPILLTYGSKNSDVIKLLHTTLNEQYVTDNLVSFADHFNNVDKKLSKIKWKGKQSILCAIFNDSLTKQKIRLPGVSIKNYPLQEILAEHFCKVNGDDLKPKSLRVQLAKQKKGINVPGMEEMLPILLNIKSYKNA